MQVAAEKNKNDIEWVDNVYANNEYVEFEYPYSDKFQGDDWADMTIVENIFAEHSRSAPPTATDDCKVEDI